MTRIHTVEGGGGVPLHVRDVGPEDAPPILLIHGLMGCHMVWTLQTGSDLANDHRLVAMDMRGHGASSKPDDPEAYADGDLWAADVANVIAALDLHRPVLVGWSYGGRLIGEYLRVHGDGALGGVALIGGIIRLRTGVTPGGFFDRLASEDIAQMVPTTIEAVRNMTKAPLSPELFHAKLAWNMLCPPRVRRFMVDQKCDLTAAYAASTCPALILHGTEDVFVPAEIMNHSAATLPRASLVALDGIGHTPHLEAPGRTNSALRALAAQRAVP